MPLSTAVALSGKATPGSRPEYHHGWHVTDRDLIIRGLVDGKDIQRSTARDVMTGEMFWCYEDADVKNVVNHMQEKRGRRILVINHDKRVVGIVSIGDITRASTEFAGETRRKLRCRRLAKAPSPRTDWASRAL